MSGFSRLTISASDQNSNMPFSRNEFSKIFEDFFTMIFFTNMTHIYDVDDILKLDGCKMFYRR